MAIVEASMCFSVASKRSSPSALASDGAAIPLIQPMLDPSRSRTLIAKAS